MTEYLVGIPEAVWTWLWGNSLAANYAVAMRSSLFSGFLSLSAFLFSSHTFIVMHMKKEHYDSDEYLDLMAGVVQAAPERPILGTLRELSQCILASVVSALVAAISQLTIGLLNYNWAALLCLLLAAGAIACLGYSIKVMHANLTAWFGGLEDKAKKNVLARAEKLASTPLVAPDPTPVPRTPGSATDAAVPPTKKEWADPGL